MTVQRNEIIEYIVEMVASTLCKHGIDRPAAKQVGDDFADALSSSFGGKQFCIPSNIDTSNRATTKKINFEKATDRRYELLGFIESQIMLLTHELPLKKVTPKEIADCVKNRFMKDFLCKNFVIPKDMKYKLWRRDQKILKEFNGLNLRYLADEYGI